MSTDESQGQVRNLVSLFLSAVFPFFSPMNRKIMIKLGKAVAGKLMGFPDNIRLVFTGNCVQTQCC